MDFPDLLDVPLELPVVCAWSRTWEEVLALQNLRFPEPVHPCRSILCGSFPCRPHVYQSARSSWSRISRGRLWEGTDWMGIPGYIMCYRQGGGQIELLNGVQNGVEAFLPALHISGHKGLISHYLPKGFHK